MELIQAITEIKAEKNEPTGGNMRGIGEGRQGLGRLYFGNCSEILEVIYEELKGAKTGKCFK